MSQLVPVNVHRSRRKTFNCGMHKIAVNQKSGQDIFLKIFFPNFRINLTYWTRNIAICKKLQKEAM